MNGSYNNNTGRYGGPGSYGGPGNYGNYGTGNYGQQGYGTGNTGNTGNTGSTGQTYGNSGQYGFTMPGYGNNNTGNTYNTNNTSYSAGSQKPAKPPKPPKEKKERKPMGAGRVIAFALIFGLISGGTFAGVNYATGWFTQKSGSQPTSQLSTVQLPTSNGTNVDTSNTEITAIDVSKLVDAVMPSVVTISNVSVKEYTNMIGQKGQQTSKSLGTGFIIHQSDTELLIATNNHVVDGATELTVGFCDGQAATATIKEVDVTTDMAVIAVPLSNMQQSTIDSIRIAKLGDSNKLQVGQTAIVIGNAMGYGQSVTTGVISALNRHITNEGVTYEVIQTDAAINPGNSGGAMINAAGEVVGVSNAKCAANYVEGLCYAIPIANAMPVIEKAISGKSTTQPTTPSTQESREAETSTENIKLGITGVNIGASEQSKYNIPMGVYITKVEAGSVAEKAGLKVTDVIYSFGGSEVGSVATLNELIQAHRSGDTVSIQFYRSAGSSYTRQETTVQF